MDRYWFNDNNRDDSWDAVWDVAVSRDAHGWTAEFRIPFSQLRFSRAAASDVGLRGVAATSAALNETATWPLLSRSANGYVSSFGELAGLSMAGVAEAARAGAIRRRPAVTRQPTGGQPAARARRRRTAPSAWT